ncbi:MAG: hypothetical protein U9R44_03355 [Candidatus Omnitrophota bacterium]|nr:hypothetical protein [Candidatus Omnitrophota bacterium]
MNKTRTKNNGFAMAVMAVMVVLVMAWVVIITPVPRAHADEWVTRQISDNTYIDAEPSLYNGTIAWVHHIPAGDWQQRHIYYWDGTSTTQITPYEKSTYEEPSLYNGKIAWRDGYVYYWDGTSTTQMPIPGGGQHSPSLYNGKIAYIVGGGVFDVHYWDGGTATNISNNTAGTWSGSPSLYNGTIAWQTWQDGGYGINYWDGGTTTQISVSGANPSLYNGTIAWADNGINYWDGGTTTQISVSGANPSLYNGTIAWAGNGINYWDGGTTTQISGSGTNPSLYNGDITWQGSDGNDDEIFYARLASAWIGDAIDSLGLAGYTEAEILDLADLFSGQTSGLVNSMDWTYLAGNLPGDTGGEVYDIGNSWEYDGKYYIKLGSGLEGTGVPELPAGAIPFIGAILCFGLRRLRRFHK